MGRGFASMRMFANALGKCGMVSFKHTLNVYILLISILKLGAAGGVACGFLRQPTR
jgi:hypothetical protein